MSKISDRLWNEALAAYNAARGAGIKRDHGGDARAPSLDYERGRRDGLIEALRICTEREPVEIYERLVDGSMRLVRELDRLDQPCHVTREQLWRDARRRAHP